MEKSIHSQEYAQFLQLLRAVREEAGLTQGDVASRLGATQSFVSKCERGERRLDVVELRAWCTALDITLLKFLRRFEDSCQR
jgi:transcriptional regulator with XRE-family HTH domain